MPDDYYLSLHDYLFRTIARTVDTLAWVATLLVVFG